MPIINSKIGFVDAVDPDLSKFKAHGGKLLLYAGWGDTTITPENTVLYYENLKKKMGPQDDFVRLFMVPGMAHCRGGDGPNTFDSIGAMEAWREKGITPTQLTGFNPQTSLTRPICSYPQYTEIQGHRKHQGRRQLDVRGAVRPEARTPITRRPLQRDESAAAMRRERSGLWHRHGAFREQIADSETPCLAGLKNPVDELVTLFDLSARVACRSSCTTCVETPRADWCSSARTTSWPCGRSRR